MSTPVRPNVSLITTAHVPIRLFVVFVATFLSVVGDSASSLTLVLNGAVGRPAWWVTEAFLAELIPPLLLAPLLGAVVDTLDAKRIWLWCLALQACLFTGAAAVETFHVRVFLVALSGVCAVATSTASFKLLPHIAAPWPVSSANSTMTAVSSAAFLVGPGVGGAMFASLGPTVLFAANAATFAVMLLAIFSAVPPGTAEHVSVEGNAFEGATRGLKSLRNSSIVGPLLPLLAGVVFTTSVEGVAGVFYLRQVAGGDAIYGLLLSVWAAGSIPGSLIGAFRWFDNRDRLLVVGGAAFISLALLVEGLVPSAIVIAGIFFVGGFGNGAHNVGLRNGIHHGVPANQHGRAWASYSAIANSCVALGYFAGTPYGLLTSRQLVIASGVMATLMTGYGLLRLRGALIARTPLVPALAAAEASSVSVGEVE